MTSEVVLPLGVFLRPELPAAALHGLPGEAPLALDAATGAEKAALLMTFLAMLVGCGVKKY